jgi:hypothetical protein
MKSGKLANDSDTQYRQHTMPHPNVLVEDVGHFRHRCDINLFNVKQGVCPVSNIIFCSSIRGT